MKQYLFNKLIVDVKRVQSKGQACQQRRLLQRSQRGNGAWCIRGPGLDEILRLELAVNSSHVSNLFYKVITKHTKAPQWHGFDMEFSQSWPFSVSWIFARACYWIGADCGWCSQEVKCLLLPSLWTWHVDQTNIIIDRYILGTKLTLCVPFAARMQRKLIT